MKRILILLFFIPFLGSAQQEDTRLFALRPNGFRALPDTSKGYIIIDVPKVSKANLYKRALKKVNQIYNNPKYVTANIPGESIIIHARQGRVFHRLGYSKLDIDYSFELDFKDEKAKLEPLSFSFETVTGLQLYLIDPGGWQVRGVFNKDGTLQDSKAKATIDAFFNGIVQEIIEGLKIDDSANW